MSGFLKILVEFVLMITVLIVFIYSVKHTKKIYNIGQVKKILELLPDGKTCQKNEPGWLANVVTRDSCPLMST